MTATALYDLDPCSLSPEQRIDALIESERELARLSARQQRIITAISEEPFPGEPAPELDKQYFLEQVRATLGDSLDGVRSRVATATTLVHRLPDTLAALEAGTLTQRQAWRLADQTRPLDDAAAGKVQEAVLEYMQTRRDHRDHRNARHAGMSRTAAVGPGLSRGRPARQPHACAATASGTRRSGRRC